ncbi:unnamed protein product [Closterium sp. NIES-53]
MFLVRVLLLSLALHPSYVPLQVPLPSPPASSLPGVPDPESDLAHAASPFVLRLLATVVTDPSFESTAASALVAELVDFAASCRLDYATSLVADSESGCPPSVGRECALGTDFLEDRGTGAAGAGGVGGTGAGDPGAGGTRAEDHAVGGTFAGGAGAGGAGAGGTGAGDPRAGGAGAGDPGAGGASVGGAEAGCTGAGGTMQRQLFFIPPPPDSVLCQVLSLPSSTGLSPSLLCPPPHQSQPQLHPDSPLPAPSPYAEQTDSLKERREPESCPASPFRAFRTGRRVPRPRPHLVPGTHIMALRPSSVPLRVPLPSPPAASLADGLDPESDLVCADSPTVTRLLATVVTGPSFESAVTSALVAELVDLAAACRLNYAASLVAESESDYPPSIEAAVPHLVAMLLAPEGDPDAPDIPTPRSYVEAITGPYSSQWQTAMDAEMASPKSTGTYVDAVPPSGANIVVGMWIFRVKRPPGQPARGDLATPPTWLHLVDSYRMTLAALGFAPSTADPSRFVRTDTSLLPFYFLMYVDDLVFATTDTEALALVLQRFGFWYSSPQSTPLPTGHLLSAPPSDESVEPSGLYPELVGCLMYLMTCTRPDPAYPLSILARYVAPGRHRPEHWEAAKRVLRYLCSTSGMGLVLGGQGPVVLIGQADASWVDDLATQWSSQGYTFSLGPDSVSWRSTSLSSVLSSNCEAEIYAGAMAAPELRWLTYLLTDLGERSRSSPVLLVAIFFVLGMCGDFVIHPELALLFLTVHEETMEQSIVTSGAGGGVGGKEGGNKMGGEWHELVIM